jgi:dihydrolipoamide dehydrogenase
VSEHTFDVIVVGGGPAGEAAAGKLGQAGLSVALVESHLIGGECSYYACMPSKALLRPAEALAEARRVPGAAEAAAGELDVEAVLRRRDQIVHGLDDSDQLPWLDERSVTVFRGHGRLDGERRVQVGDDLLMAKRAVVLAVGTAAVMPPIPGLAEARPWTNREATTSPSVPERLLVLGGGVVGVELAQAWATLGSTVTLVELFERLLVREEPFASEEVARSLDGLGVDVRTGAEAVRVHRHHETVTIELADGGRVTGTELLVAIGRRPLTGEIGLDSVGLEPGAPIEVDDGMRVSDREWLYAIGDVNGRALLTHMGKYQARIAVENILGGDARVARPAQGPLAPRVVFTDPQVAAVGHTLESAEKQGIRAVAVDHPTGGSAGSSFYGRKAPGTTRLVFDAKRNVLVGATFVGPDVAEMLHAATIAIVGEVSAARLGHAVPAFPTRSEVWLRLLEKYASARTNSVVSVREAA